MLKTLKRDIYTSSKVVFLDLDGTVYRGHMPLEDRSIVNALIHQKLVVFMTNSGTKTPTDVRDKLLAIGFCFANERFHCHTALAHLHDILCQLEDKSIFYISNKNIRDTVGDDASLNSLTIDLAKEIVEHGRASVTIVAFFVDTIERLDIDQLLTATLILVANGAQVYFSAGDHIVPTTSGNGEYVNHPGPGCLVAMLKAATLTRHHSNIHVLGKGSDRLFMESAFNIARRHIPDLTWPDVIVIGDNPMTDIASGLQMGATTVLVTSGMPSDHEHLMYNRPHLVANTLGELMTSGMTRIGFQDVIDVATRQALHIHRRINNLTNHSLAICLTGISRAPLRKTQSLPSRLDGFHHQSHQTQRHHPAPRAHGK